jgi:hypothetical protein
MALDGRTREGKLQKLKDQEAAANGELKGADATTSGVRAARRQNRRSLGQFGLAKARAVQGNAAPTTKAKLKARAIFRYADGSFFPINSTEGRIIGLGLVAATDENAVTSINGSVRALSPGKGKTLSFSFGFTEGTGRGITRNRTQSQGKGNKRKKRKANGGKRYFSTITVPSDATFDDCIAFVNSWGKKPEIIKLGKQQIKISGVVAKKVLYNNAYGLLS